VEKSEIAGFRSDALIPFTLNKSERASLATKSCNQASHQVPHAVSARAEIKPAKKSRNKAKRGQVISPHHIGWLREGD
jgi:hypothetical protein